jgi:RNA polymerase sigma-70 factor, ECF subfamily
MSQLSDEELIAASRAAGGLQHSDPHLAELFTRHQRKVALWCLRYCGDREEAKDLTQEIFANCFRRLDSFQGNSKFTTWLYTVSRNHCLNALKAKASRPQAENGEPLLADLSGEPVDVRLARDQQVELARTWIREALEETERRVFVMHYEEEMPLEVITRVLGLKNPSGAKAFIVSARRKLSEVARRWRAQHERK